MPALALVVLTMLLFISQSLRAAPPAHLLFYAVDYPPFIIVNPDGSITGKDIETIQAAYAEKGIHVEFATAPWKRILKGMQHGSIVGTSTCSRRPEREPYMLFSEKISEVRQTALSLYSTNTDAIKELKHLNQFSVVTVEGWSVDTQLTNLRIAHTRTSSPDDAIRQVVNNRVQIFYSGQQSTLFRASQMGYGGLLKSAPLEDVPIIDYFLCISKHYPNADQLLHLFNQGLKEIKQNGILASILEKYHQ